MDIVIKNRLKIYMFAFISFLLGTSQFVVGGILDKIASSVGVPVSTAGQIVTAFSLAGAFGTPIVMMTLAKLDRRRLLMLALTAILISSITTVLLPGFGFLIASRILFGVGFGVYGVSAFTIVAKLAPPGRQASALANLAMGASAALVIGVPIGRIVAATYAWQWIFWAISFFSLLAILAIAKLIPSTQGEAPIPLGTQLSYLKKPKISLALSVAFMMFVSYSVVNTFLTPFLIALLPEIEAGMSIVLLGLGIASFIGSKLGGMLADRLGPTRTLVGGMVAQAAALLLVVILPKSAVVMIPLLLVWAMAAWLAVRP